MREGPQVTTFGGYGTHFHVIQPLLQVIGVAEACATKGVLLHEIGLLISEILDFVFFSGHSLGLHHTHSRTDRDAHVILKPDNVR